MEQNFYTFEVERYGDDRGALISLEYMKNLPFEIKRVYFIYDVKEGKKRANHAHRESQRVLIAINGSCKVRVFDGKNEMNFKLDNPQKALYFNKGVWCELSDFNLGTIVLAISNQIYTEKDYIRDYDQFLEFKENGAKLNV